MSKSHWRGKRPSGSDNPEEVGLVLIFKKWLLSEWEYDYDYEEDD